MRCLELLQTAGIEGMPTPLTSLNQFVNDCSNADSRPPNLRSCEGEEEVLQPPRPARPVTRPHEQEQLDSRSEIRVFNA